MRLCKVCNLNCSEIMHICDCCFTALESTGYYNSEFYHEVEKSENMEWRYAVMRSWIQMNSDVKVVDWASLP